MHAMALKGTYSYCISIMFNYSIGRYPKYIVIKQSIYILIYVYIMLIGINVLKILMFFQ